MKRRILLCLFIVTGLNTYSQTIGNYNNLTVTLSEDTIVAPDTPPSGYSALNISTSSIFSGILTLDPVTGIVRITNPKPAGTYALKISSGTTILRTITLTVSNAICSRGNFNGNSSVSVGTNPIAIAVGDFNSDKNQDIATANYTSNTVSIRLGDGAGGLAGILELSTDLSPNSIAVSDLNNDGKQDLAVSNFGSNNVNIFLGDGAGNFVENPEVQTGNGPMGVAIADFNNDGFKDLSTVNSSSNTVSIRMGNGSGNFSGTTEVAVGTNPHAFALGDLNNDSKIDFIAANYNSTVSIRMGTGLGTFSGTSNNGVSLNQVTSIVLSDFSGEGLLDFALASSTNNIVFIYYGNGGGYSGPHISLTALNQPGLIATGDFSGDGTIDIAIPNKGSDSIVTWNGFAINTPNSVINAGNGNQPTAVAVGDFNNDGLQDVVTTFSGNNSAAINFGTQGGFKVNGNYNFISNGSNIFSTSDNTDFGDVPNNGSIVKNFTVRNTGFPSTTISSITVSGMNASEFSVTGITFPKLVPATDSVSFSVACSPTTTGLKFATITVNYTDCTPLTYSYDIRANSITPILNSYLATSVSASSNISISPTQPHVGVQKLSARASSGFTGLLAADSATGIVRIVNAKPAGNYTITVSSGITPDQTFNLTVLNPPCSPGQFSGPVNFSMTQPRYIRTGDFNKDGIQDLVNISANRFLNVALGNGSGGFTTISNTFVNINSDFITIADFNEDGNLDLVINNQSSSQINVYFGNGSGGFPTNIILNNGSQPGESVVGDFNNDGNIDLVTVNRLSSGSFSIRLGNGNGTFQSPSSVSVGAIPINITSGDFNSDNNLDIAVSNSASASVSIKLGNGSGGFTGTTVLAVGTTPHGLTTGDFNSDNKLDLAICNFASDNISISLGNGNGTFTNANTLGSHFRPHSIEVGDFNGDGKQDLATTGLNSVYLNLGSGSGNFNSTADLGFGVSPENVTVGDFNTDLIQDIIVSDDFNNAAMIAFGENLGMYITGNADTISDGNAITSLFNNTDFGIVPVSGSIFKEYKILNTGISPIQLSSITFTGNNASNFSVTDITLPSSIPALGSATFKIKCSPQSIGIKSAIVHIIHTECGQMDYDFAITANAVQPVLGTYNNTSVVVGENIDILPVTNPQNTTYTHISASPLFSGNLRVDPATGIIQVTNANTAGTYVITLRLGSLIQTFNLTVTNPFCSSGSFNNEAPDISGRSFAIVDDFNNDNHQDVLSIDQFGIPTIFGGDGLGNLFFYNSLMLPGQQVKSAVTGDFNGDGLSDVVTVGNGSAVHMSNNFGGYDSYFETSFNSSYDHLAKGDFNNDGIYDLAAASSNGNTVSIRLGDGTGNFTGNTEISVATFPNFIAVGDFNNDNKQDLAISCATTNNVQIKLGNGLGGFSGSTSLSVGNRPNYIVIGDFNGDNKQDLAISKNYVTVGNTISLRYGNGTGGFTGSVELYTERTPMSMALGDLNADGRNDLIVVDKYSNSVALYAGNSGASFNPLVRLTRPQSSISPVFATIGDFNEDNVLDILSMDETLGVIFKGVQNNVTVTSNDFPIVDGSNVTGVSNNTDYGNIPVGAATTRTFTFNNNSISPVFITGISFTGTNATEFSSTGNSFPITVQPGSVAGISVLCNPTSAGTKSASIHIDHNLCLSDSYDFDLVANAVNISLGNYDAASVYAGGNITLIPTSPAINITAMYANAPPAFKGIIKADPSTGDIIVTDARPSGNYTISVSAGNITRTFILTVTKPPCSPGTFTNPVGTGVSSFANHTVVLDYNKDGHQDYATVSSFFDIKIFTGDGQGNFTVAYSHYHGLEYDYLDVADFNRDGFDDFIVTGKYLPYVSVLLSDNSGFPSMMYNIPDIVSPKKVYTGDFNNDGKTDISILNQYLNRVSVRLGDGAGSFGTSKDLTAIAPYLLAINDFNNDGKADFVITNATSSTALVRIGDGNGNFTGTGTINLGNTPVSIISGDFNNDGKQDIITGNSNNITNSYSVRLGNGTGGFTGTSTVTTPWYATSMSAGNFNGDNFQDFVFTSNYVNANLAYVMLGNGTGTFTTSTTPSYSNPSPSTLVGDFNEDGYHDFIISSGSSEHIHYGTNNEINLSANSIVISDGSTLISSAINTDFGSTSVPVIKTFSIHNTGVVPLTINSITITGLNPGDFSFSGISFPLTIAQNDSYNFNIIFTPSATGIRSAVIHINNSNCVNSDFDFAVQGSGFGLPELGNYPAATIYAGGNLVVSPSAAPVNTNYLSASASTSFTGVIVADPVTGEIQITNAKPAGTYTVTVRSGGVTKTFVLTVTNTPCTQNFFSTPTTIPVESDPLGLAVGDFNNDGIQDLVSASHGPSRSLMILFGNGSGGFTNGPVITNSPLGTHTYAVVVGDFNGDGNQDLAYPLASAGRVIINLGNGSGGFSISSTIVVGSTPNDISLGDFNKDGRLDFATTNFNTNDVSIRLGDGLGGFTGTTQISVGTNPTSLVIGDFNNDGNQDFVATNSNMTASIKFGDGIGGFSGTSTVAIGINTTGIAIADVNNDNKQDLIVANSGSTTMILIGNGSGGFTPGSFVFAGSVPYYGAVGDFNSDGNQDIVVANSTHPSFTVSLCTGNGLGGFSSPVQFAVGNYPRTIVVGDFNQDGKQDFIVSNSGHNNLSVFLAATNEIDVRGNSNQIADGSTTVSATNNTDFGAVNPFTNVVKTFTIQNPSLNPLSLSSILVTGTNSNEFTVSGITLPQTLAAGSSVTFNITFRPLGYGTRTAIIHVNNNDCDEGDYDFTVQGSGNCIPPGFSICPGNLTLTASAGSCTRAATYTITTSGVPIATFVTTFSGATNITVNGNGNGTILQTGVTHVLITATNLCGSATCEFDITVNSQLNDNNACTVDGCNTTTGTITRTNADPNDNNLCTTDGCNTVSGIFNIPVNTDDNNVCTEDGCDSTTGIYHNQILTDDNNACTTDGCDSVSGIFHNPVSTDDGNACTDDGCDSITGVYHTPVSTYDGNACTDDDCDTMTGVYHNPVSTDDGNACTLDGCDSISGVYHNPVSTDDGNACTLDGCDSISGVYHNPVSTDDGNACTDDGCDTLTGVYHNPVSTDDGYACTDDGCDSISGVYHNPVSTDDGNACTDDGCDSVTGIFHNPVSTDDGNACTDDGCDSITGVYHNPVATDDGNICTIDGCDTSTGVYHDPVDTDDANACTADACDSVIGIHHDLYPVDDGNACTDDACNTLTGLITHTPIYIGDNDDCTLDACNTLDGTITHTDDSPEIILAADSIVCYGETTCLIVNATGGLPPYFGTGTFCGYSAGTYIVDVTDSKGCSVTKEITIGEPSKLNLSASSTPASCLQNDGTATATVSGGVDPYSYVWSAGLQTTSSISGLSPGTYFITVTDDNGCTESASVNVGSSGGTPVAPGPISGPAGACRKQSGVVYCIQPVVGTDSYIWMLPAGAAVNGPATGACITVNFSSKFKGGYICVKAVSACGTSSMTCLNVVRINKPPHTPGVINGPATMCPNSIATYSIANVLHATNYEWTSNGGIVIISGQGTNSITVSTPSNFNKGDVKVRTVNCKGHSGWRTSKIKVGMNCRLENNYQIETTVSNSFKVYPNPTDGKFTVEIETVNATRMNLQVSDLMGKIIFNDDIQTSDGMSRKEINLNEIAKGIYLICLKNVAGTKWTEKLLIE